MFLGVGAGLLVVPSNVAMIPHFAKKLAFANAVGNSGVVFGFMMLPPVAEFLTGIYGWRGSVLIFSAILFHLCALAALLRPDLFHHSEFPTEPDESKTGVQHTQMFEGIDYDDDERRELICDSNRNKYEHLLVRLHVALFTLLGLSVITWALFLVPHAVDSGMPLTKAVFLSSAGGVGKYKTICQLI